MRADLLSEAEGDPEAWPAVMARFPNRPTDDDNPDIPAAVTWRRIEAWTAHRWPARSVAYLVRGPGEWTPRLSPFIVSTAERWTGSAWEAATLEASPIGYTIDGATWRITGTAGDDSDPPEAVLEAWRRLHEYSLGIAREWWADAAIYSEGDRQGTAAWAAKAIHLSGAADLLRPYRRLGA